MKSGDGPAMLVDNDGDPTALDLGSTSSKATQQFPSEAPIEEAGAMTSNKKSAGDELDDILGDSIPSARVAKKSPVKRYGPLHLCFHLYQSKESVKNI